MLLELHASAICTRQSASSCRLTLHANCQTLLLLADAYMSLMHASDEDLQMNIRVETWCLLNTGEAPRHHPTGGPKIAPGPLNKGDHAGCVAQHTTGSSCRLAVINVFMLHSVISP